MTYEITPKICVRDYGTDSVVLEVSNSEIYNGLVKVCVEDQLIQYFDPNDISYHKIDSEFENTLYDYGRRKLILHRNKFKSKRVSFGCIIQ